MLRITDVVKHLLIINVLMFVVTGFIFPDLKNVLALHYPASEAFRPIQIATHFFMHANFAHLFFNMFALWMFGSALETLWGAQRFLFFYFFCAFGAAILHTLVSYYEITHLQQMVDTFRLNPSYENFWAFFDGVPFNQLNPWYQEEVNNISDILQRSSLAAGDVGQTAQLMDLYVKSKMDIPVVGASGAIYGLLLAFGMKFPNTELMLIFLPIPVKAKYFIPFLMVAELFLGVNQFSWDNIAHFAHLGGALSGFLLILYWRKFGSRYE